MLQNPTTTEKIIILCGRRLNKSIDFYYIVLNKFLLLSMAMKYPLDPRCIICNILFLLLKKINIKISIALFFPHFFPSYLAVAVVRSKICMLIMKCKRERDWNGKYNFLVHHQWKKIKKNDVERRKEERFDVE